MPTWIQRHPWISVGGFFLLLTLTGIGLYLPTQVGDRDWWRREAEDYNRRHAVPDAENAVSLYPGLSIRNLSNLARSLETSWNLPLATSDLAFLEAQAPALQGLRESASRRSCWIPADTSLDTLAEQPLVHLSPMKQGVKLLALQARGLAGAGRSEEAVESLLDAARIGYQTREGFQICHLVAVSCRNLAWENLDRMALKAPPSPGTLESLTRKLEALEASRPSMESLFQWERILCRDMVERLYRPGTDWKEMRMWSAMQGSVGGILELPWPLLALDSPLQACRTELEEGFLILAKEAPTADELARLTKLQAKGTLPVRTLLPGLTAARDAARKETLHAAQTRMLLRLKAQQLRTGRWPETLPEPVPGLTYECLQEGKHMRLSSEAAVLTDRKIEPVKP